MLYWRGLLFNTEKFSHAMIRGIGSPAVKYEVHIFMDTHQIHTNSALSATFSTKKEAVEAMEELVGLMRRYRIEEEL